MVYFIEDGRRGRIKIGTTIALANRFYMLRREHGDHLQVLGIVDGDRKAEKALHLMFAACRLYNEWFADDTTIRLYIAQNARPWTPEEDRPIAVIVSLKGVPELGDWIAELTKHSESGSVANMLRRSLKALAESEGFTVPMPER